MKMSYMILIALLLISGGITIYAQDSIKVLSKFTEEDIELNYLVGVKNENIGLKISAAYHLGERKSKKAVIPLMDMLKNPAYPTEARIMAALSLYKIGDERGIYAIKQAIKYDENEQVKKMCSIFYQMHEVDKTQAK